MKPLAEEKSRQPRQTIKNMPENSRKSKNTDRQDSGVT